MRRVHIAGDDSEELNILFGECTGQARRIAEFDLAVGFAGDTGMGIIHEAASCVGEGVATRIFPWSGR